MEEKERYDNKKYKQKYYSNPINRLKSVYGAMVRRCYCPDSNSYKKYGGKGIFVCKEWLDNPNSFYNWALNNGYNYIPNKNGRNSISLDRIDFNKGYSPENCRWVDDNTQQNNRSNNIFYEYNGRKDTLRNWCKKLNIPYAKMYYRINTKHKSFEEALLGIKYHFKDKIPKQGYRFIHKERKTFVININHKVYGRSKTLKDAIILRNSILKDMGIYDEISLFEKENVYE